MMPVGFSAPEVIKNILKTFPSHRSYSAGRQNEAALCRHACFIAEPHLFTFDIQGTFVNMKKPLAMALALLIGTTAVSAHAADGIIKITGSVVGTTCTVEGTDTSNGPQGTLKTINLQLDPVSISALNAPSKMAGGKPFTIRLSDCTAQNAKVKFETMGLVDTSSGFLKNEGDAENVQVALTTSDDELIKIGQDDGQEITLVEGKGEANFKAYYVASTGAAEPGSVDTSATFSLIYN
ncbi:hypothetical protein IPC274_22980 [Pseudomonas aeruginosa]|nr:hypothetical protein IPC358_21685 [Pseudomonas aeruginosa]RQF50953.1 hypothetical protein IPC274_22980 [Pseudomonas aeruginosa]